MVKVFVSFQERRNNYVVEAKVLENNENKIGGEGFKIKSLLEEMKRCNVFPPCVPTVWEKLITSHSLWPCFLIFLYLIKICKSLNGAIRKADVLLRLNFAYRNSDPN